MGGEHICDTCGQRHKEPRCPTCTTQGDLHYDTLAETLDIEVAIQAASQEEPQAVLVHLATGNTYPVAMPICRLGRAPINEICLTGDQSVSRFHGLICADNGNYSIRDCGSRNGIYVNGKRVVDGQALSGGELIQLGFTRFKFLLVASVAEALELAPYIVAEEFSDVQATEIISSLERSGGANQGDSRWRSAN